MHTRGLYLPYKASNPRSINGAANRGWTVIQVDCNTHPTHTTWTGLGIWCDCNAKGYWMANFARRKFAFELQSDAVAFALKWAGR